MTKSKSSVCYRILVVLSLLAGVLINVIKTSSLPAILSYYTLQSNILCLVVFVCILFKELRKQSYKSEVYYLVKGGITIAILITGLTYLFALAPTGFCMDFQQKTLANKTIYVGRSQQIIFFAFKPIKYITRSVSTTEGTKYRAETIIYLNMLLSRNYNIYDGSDKNIIVGKL